VYVRRNKKLSNAWWGRYVESVETEAGTKRVHRNVRLGEAKLLTYTLAKRALAPYLNSVNNYQPLALNTQAMEKASTPFAVFAARWQAEVLIHMKASTIPTMRGHINNLFIPTFGKLAMGDLDSERVQSFLNRQVGRVSTKTIKNIWGTLSLMWNSAVDWKYVTGELRVKRSKARRLRMRCFTVLEVKRILAHTQGAEQVFFWLAAETGMRVGEIVALRVSDVTDLSVDVNKSISHGIEDTTKTDAGVRIVCISSRLASQVKEYLAGRTDGYLFQTSDGGPWDKDNVLPRVLNPLLERLGIPKYEPKLLAKFVERGNRSIEQATRSEKRAASLGIHSFRHTNATAMDSLHIPEQIRKQRLGHSGESVTDIYTHTFTEDELSAAAKLGELFGTGWPEIDKGKVLSFPNLSQKQKEPPMAKPEALSNQ